MLQKNIIEPARRSLLAVIALAIAVLSFVRSSAPPAPSMPPAPPSVPVATSTFRTTDLIVDNTAMVGGISTFSGISTFDNSVQINSTLGVTGTPTVITDATFNGGEVTFNGFLDDFGGQTPPTSDATNGLATNSTNTMGRIRPGVQSTITLTFGAKPPNGAFCVATTDDGGLSLTAAGVEVDTSHADATDGGFVLFLCFDTTTGVAANCPNINYRCERF